MSGVNFTPDAARKIVRGSQEGIKGDVRTRPGHMTHKNSQPSMLVTDVAPKVNQPGAVWLDFEKGVIFFNYKKTVGTQTVVVRDYIGVYRGTPGATVSNLRNGSLYFVEVET